MLLVSSLFATKTKLGQITRDAPSGEWRRVRGAGDLVRGRAPEPRDPAALAACAAPALSLARKSFILLTFSHKTQVREDIF